MTEPEFVELLDRCVDSAKSVDLSWLPSRDSVWSMAPDALRFLAALTCQLRPTRILEFGAGISTAVIARASSALPAGCHMCSMEHDPVYIEQVQHELLAQLAPGTFECRLAPLVVRLVAERWVPVYLDRGPAPFGERAAELIVVDGPPEPLGGREGVLYQALDYAEPGALIVLDDADRPHMAAALQRWRENLGPALVLRRLAGFQRGLTCALVLNPVSRGELDGWREKLTVDELQREVAAPHGFVLIDDGRLQLPPALATRRMTLNETGDWPPAAAEEAIDRLKHLQRRGCTFIAFSWPSLWWLDHYSKLTEFLNHSATVRLRNIRLCIMQFVRDKYRRESRRRQ